MSATCLGIIPARAGSKGIRGKNTRLLAGRPLICHTFDAATGSRVLNRTILTTDSPEIAALGRAAGIEVPFPRPETLAADDTPTVEVIRHALDCLATREGYFPDLVAILQPTAPLRSAEDIDAALNLLLQSSADSIVSVTAVPAHYHPEWQFHLVDGELRLFGGQPLEDIVTQRQRLSRTYTRNGAIYAFWRRALERTGSVYGERCMAYVMPPERSVNIDQPEDLVAAEIWLQQHAGARSS